MVGLCTVFVHELFAYVCIDMSKKIFANRASSSATDLQIDLLEELQGTREYCARPSNIEEYERFAYYVACLLTFAFLQYRNRDE